MVFDRKLGVVMAGRESRKSGSTDVTNVAKKSRPIGRGTPRNPPMGRAAGVAKEEGELESLLTQAAELFRDAISQKKILFSLSWKKGVWVFEVMNAWQLWIEKGLRYEFAAKSPALAVSDFLRYVADKKISVTAMVIPD